MFFKTTVCYEKLFLGPREPRLAIKNVQADFRRNNRKFILMYSYIETD